MTAYKIASVAICNNFIRRDLSWNWISNLVVRLAIWTLGNWKPKNSWHALTISMLLVLNNFIKNLLMTKSREAIWCLLSTQASRPYSNIGTDLLLKSCIVTSSEATRRASLSTTAGQIMHVVWEMCSCLLDSDCTKWERWDEERKAFMFQRRICLGKQSLFCWNRIGFYGRYYNKKNNLVCFHTCCCLLL